MLKFKYFNFNRMHIYEFVMQFFYIEISKILEIESIIKSIVIIYNCIIEIYIVKFQIKEILVYINETIYEFN